MAGRVQRLPNRSELRGLFSAERLRTEAPIPETAAHTEFTDIGHRAGYLPQPMLAVRDARNAV